MLLADSLGYKPIDLHRFPHMLLEDSAVWRHYLDISTDLPELVWYDVHVGTAVEPLPGSPEWLKKVADGVSRKRIDVVAKFIDHYKVIEIKPVGSMTAIGQVVTYRRLLSVEYPNLGPFVGCILCETIDQDLLRVAADYDIEVIALSGVSF